MRYMALSAVLCGVVAVATALGCSGDRPERGLAAEARARAHDGDLSPAIPILNVHNLRASQRYYRDALGFKVEWEDGDPPDFGAVSRGKMTLFMCQGCQGNPGTWIMAFTPDVDRLYQDLRKRKAIIRMPPTNMPWRLREMHVSDVDGNVIRFGGQIRH
jgi:catechol 2,3-dioxygenase-like lactoylglutathione lyase family enzyme